MVGILIYSLKMSIARQTKQVPEYTKLKGLEKDKLKQMVIQFLQNSEAENPTVLTSSDRNPTVLMVSTNQSDRK